MQRATTENAEDTPPKARTEQASVLMSALREFAASRGLPPDALLERLRDLSDQPTLGGIDCLTPIEIAELCSSPQSPDSLALREARHEHISLCEDCQALIAGNLPSTEHLEEFLAALEEPRLATSKQSAASGVDRVNSRSR